MTSLQGWNLNIIPQLCNNKNRQNLRMVEESLQAADMMCNVMDTEFLACQENGSKKAAGSLPKSSKALGDIKWKKLAAKELQGVERMSLTSLQKRVLLSAGQEGSAKAGEQFLARLEGSSQFVIADGFVNLPK